MWEDEVTLTLIGNGKFSEDILATTHAAERGRALKRAEFYRFYNGKMQRLMGQQGWKQVPPPAEREEIIKKLDEESGHFGRTRTIHLVLLPAMPSCIMCWENMQLVLKW